MPSTQVLAKDPWDKPSRPSELEITEISRRSCRLSWRPPTDDGGDSIVGYVIEYKIAGTFKWIRANDLEKVIDSSYKVSGLQEDFEYEFRVAAENRGGIGAFTSTTMPVRAKESVGKSSHTIIISSK